MELRPDIQRLSPYVPGEHVPGAIKLASNENPFGPSPKGVAAAASVLSAAHLYPEGGCTQLRSAVAALHGIDPCRITVGNGSDEVLMFIAGAYVERGDEVIVADHTFSQYRFAATVFGATTITVPLVNGTHDLPAFAAAVGPRTKIVFVCNPNNPTGTIVREDAVFDFMRNLPSRVVVVFDEAYAEYVTDNQFPQSARLGERFPNLVFTRTFSKIFGLAALRIGYAVSSPMVADHIGRLRQPFNVNTPAQTAAVAALDDTGFVDSTRRNNTLGKERMYRFFDGLSMSYYPTEANFVWVETGLDARRLADKTRELGVTIRPLNSFGMPTAVRVTVGTPDQLTRFFDVFTAAVASFDPRN